MDHTDLLERALQVLDQVDPRYQEFPARAEVREVLGHRLPPVARLEDVLRGKVWAAGRFCSG